MAMPAFDEAQSDIERWARDAFHPVWRAEHEVIDKRRKLHERPPIHPVLPPQNGAGEAAEHPVFDTNGLALSGGGIRSAAFCLGALQALAARGFIDRLDYLSTVSGGGYIGSAVSACMAQRPQSSSKVQDFPFAAPGKIEDTPAVGHLRDYSNYLLPRGHKVFTDAIVVLLRGLMTNLIIVAGVLALAAWLTLLAYPLKGVLLMGSFLPRLAAVVLAAIGLPVSDLNAAIGEHPFALTLWLLGIFAVFLGLWALWRSRKAAHGSDVRGPGVKWARYLAIAVLLVAVLDLQPVAVFALLSFSDGVSAIAGWLTRLIAVATPFAGVIGYFASKLSGFLSSSESDTRMKLRLQRLAARAVIWIAAIILPLQIYLIYLWLCAIGLDGVEIGPLSLLWGWITIPACSLLSLYFAVGALLTAMAMRFAPNANSLHRIYRDRLSKAFLFDPHRRDKAPAGNPDEDDLHQLDGIKLHEIAPPSGGPYQLINTSLNLQNSKYANRRGRNATFFLFSAAHIGSDVTGYVPTAQLEKEDRHIDLATALAISGAAVSSNMGSNSIKVLTPTLALLNIRLGYWMTNPAFMVPGSFFSAVLSGARYALVRFTSGVRMTVTNAFMRKAPMDFLPLPLSFSVLDGVKYLRRVLSDVLKFYFVAEMFGRLDERSPYIYLTDGGHIENLGLYELFKRHCRVIVVVDAECDPKLAFPSLAKLQRYARIDLGVRIDLPWEEIAETSKRVDVQALARGPIAPANGPHSAVGKIFYPNGEEGILLYVKASMTGDENDYIVNYKRRNPDFPHETTGDQFFSEEQFEVYRALGFHGVENFFNPAQHFAWTARGNWPSSPTASGPTDDDVRNYVLKMFV